MNSNPIITSVFIMTAFWWAVLATLNNFTAGGNPLLFLPYEIVFSIVFVVFSVGIGIGLRLLSDAAIALAGEQTLKSGSKMNCASTTLGFIYRDALLTKIDRADIAKETISKIQNFPWYKVVRKSSKLHERFALAILEVLLSHPKVPAAPKGVGHGGKTLFAHTMGVTMNMMREVKSYEYRGQFKKNGELAFALRGDPVSFDEHDAIPILVALCHDLGKVIEYSEEVNHRKNDRYKGLMHDKIGVMILQSMPEFLDLSLEERQQILIAVEFYHKPGYLPDMPYITDRIRALTELIRYVDITASYAESDSDNPSQEKQNTPSNELDKMAAPASKQPSTTYVDEEDEPLERHKAAQNALSFADTGLPEALDVFMQAINKLISAKPEDLIKKSPCVRRRGNYCYVSDKELRSLISMHLVSSGFSTSTISSTPHDGNIHDYTRSLMTALSERGFLVQDWQNEKLHPAKSMFMVKMIDKDGVVKSAPKSPVFIIPTSAFTLSVANKLPSSKYDYEIIRPFWGNQSKKKNSDENTLPDAEQADDDDNDQQEQTLATPEHVDAAISSNVAGADGMTFCDAPTPTPETAIPAPPKARKPEKENVLPSVKEPAPTAKPVAHSPQQQPKAITAEEDADIDEEDSMSGAEVAMFSQNISAADLPFDLAELGYGDAQAAADNLLADVDAPAGDAQAAGDDLLADVDTPADDAQAAADNLLADVDTPADDAQAAADDLLADVDAPAGDAQAAADNLLADVDAPADDAVTLRPACTYGEAHPIVKQALTEFLHEQLLLNADFVSMRTYIFGYPVPLAKASSAIFYGIGSNSPAFEYFQRYFKHRKEKMGEAMIETEINGRIILSPHAPDGTSGLLMVRTGKDGSPLLYGRLIDINQ